MLCFLGSEEDIRLEMIPIEISSELRPVDGMMVSSGHTYAGISPFLALKALEVGSDVKGSAGVGSRSEIGISCQSCICNVRLIVARLPL